MRGLNKFYLFLFTVFLSVNSAYAVDIPETMKQAMAPDTAGMPSLLHLVVSMVVVIALIYFTGWVYSKLNIVNRNNLKKLAQKEFDTDRFTVLQSMSLGQQRHLYSIEMNGKVLLVGSTPSHINLIKEFDKDDADIGETTEKILKNEEQSQREISSGKKDLNIDEIYKKYKM